MQLSKSWFHWPYLLKMVYKTVFETQFVHIFQLSFHRLLGNMEITSFLKFEHKHSRVDKLYVYTWLKRGVNCYVRINRIVDQDHNAVTNVSWSRGQPFAAGSRRWLESTWKIRKILSYYICPALTVVLYLTEFLEVLAWYQYTWL